MIAGWGVGKVGAGNVIDSKSYTVLSIPDPTFGDRTLAVTARRAGGRPCSPVAPLPRDDCVGNQVMTGIMYRDGHNSIPLGALTSAARIQVANVHNRGYGGWRACGCWTRCGCASCGWYGARS